MRSETTISERRACDLVGMYRSTLRYEARRTAETEALSARIVELAQERSRFGYRRIHALLRREGHAVNHKRVYRFNSAANLAVKRRKRRKGVMVPREPLALPTQRNEVWSMDFVMDALANGRRLKVLTIVDDCTKEAIDLVADRRHPLLSSSSIWSPIPKQKEIGYEEALYRRANHWLSV